MVSFDFDFCYLVVDSNGYASIIDRWEGLEIYTLDSVEEAIEFLANLPED